jgi:transposase
MGHCLVFRVRELLTRQRTQTINAPRGHLAEFGYVVPQGASNALRLVALGKDPESGMPKDACTTVQVLVATLAHFETQIEALDGEIRRHARENEMARRLMTIPGIGPLIATALVTLAPPAETFRRGRDCAASCWKHASGVTLGLVPRQHLTGGKQRLGATPTLSGHCRAMPCRAADGADRLGLDGQGQRLRVSSRVGASLPSVARVSERKQARRCMAQRS